MPVIVFASSKGGAGKTTSALMVALDVAESGATVAMIDADKNQPLIDWAKKPGKPERLTVISDLSEETITDTIDAAKEKYDLVIVDNEGSASMMVAYSMLRADLVIIVTQGSKLDVKEAVKTLRLLNRQEKNYGKPIPYSILITRTDPAIRPRSLRHIEQQFTEAGLNVFTTQMHNRDAFKAVFDFGGPLSELTADQAPGVPKTQANVRKLTKEIFAILKPVAKAEAA